MITHVRTIGASTMQAYQFIVSCYRERNSAPTLREISRHLNAWHPNAAKLHLRKLVDAGIIDWQPGREPAISILRSPDELQLSGDVNGPQPLTEGRTVIDLDCMVKGKKDVVLHFLHDRKMLNEIASEGDLVVGDPESNLVCVIKG